MIRQISCERVHELLSEYIDGSLEPHLLDIIDDHLLTCDRCAEELYSLEKVIDALKSLETVKAPENFLESFQERIRPATFFDKVIRILLSAFSTVRLFFTYDHLKLSFQFIAATVVVMVIIFSIREITKLPSHLPSEREKTETAKMSDKEAPAPAPVEKTYTSERDSADFSLEEDEHKEANVITIALVIKDEKSDLPYALHFEKQREIAKKEVLSSANEGASMNDTSQRQPLKQKSQTSEARIMKSDKKERKFEEVQEGGAVLKDEASLSSLPDAFVKVKNLIESVDGTVTSFSYTDHSRMPRFIEATIPAQNFTHFTKELKLIGTFKDSLPLIPEQAGSSVSVTIEFFFSQK